MNISVIICTHNPREDYLKRVLEALDKQTLPKNQWELLLIDNASTIPLAGKWDISWHPNSRHIRENELGLTPARLRGIRESSGELLVFVDDDNVLSTEYLKIAIKLALNKPYLGALGGSISPEFEIPFPSDMAPPFINALAIGVVETVCWSNDYFHSASLPYGAGLLVRKCVANAFYQACINSPKRNLDRIGDALGGGGDTELAFTAIDLGLGMGRVPDLELTHLIGKKRLSKDYLMRIVEEGFASRIFLDYIRWRKQPYTPPRRDRIKFWLDYWATNPGYRRFMLAKEKGQRLGLELIKKAERRLRKLETIKI